MKNILTFFLLIGIGAVYAQDTAYGFYQAGIRYGEGRCDSLFIRWAHNAETDSFWVYKAMPDGEENHLKFFTDKNIKTVWYSKPIKYERRMANHHLREPIFGSPLRFADLDALAQNRQVTFGGNDLFNNYFAVGINLNFF